MHAFVQGTVLAMLPVTDLQHYDMILDGNDYCLARIPRQAGELELPAAYLSRTGGILPPCDYIQEEAATCLPLEVRPRIVRLLFVCACSCRGQLEDSRCSSWQSTSSARAALHCLVQALPRRGRCTEP